jgi:hypothetical protein
MYNGAMSGQQTRDRLGVHQSMLYPNEHTWFVFLSAMDVMLTWVILKYGGVEVNPVARLVIDHWGLTGALIFKFSLMLFVIIVCEVVGRQRGVTSGRLLIRTAIIVSALPMVYSFMLLYQRPFPQLSVDGPPSQPL